MARYPIKQLKDKNELPFFPFNTLESVLVDGTDQNLADVLNNIYTKAEVNTMFATELSKFSVYPTQADLPSTAREGAVAATNENNVYLMYMYYSGAWRALTQKGDKGDTGATGPTGPIGPTGPAGRDGAIQYTAGEGIDITNNTISVTNGTKAITQDTNIKDLDPGVYICNGDYKLYWSSDAYVQPKGILEVASHSTPTSRNFSIITKSFSYQTSSSSGGSLYPHLFVGEAPSNFTPTIKRLDTLASDDVATAYNKGLMSSTDKAKLNGISAGAEVNVQSDWNESDNTSDSYIQNKPTVPTKVSDLDNDSIQYLDYTTSSSPIILENLKPGIYWLASSTNYIYFKALNASTSTKTISPNSSSQRFVLVLTKTPSSSLSDTTYLGVIMSNTVLLSNGTVGNRWYQLTYKTNNTANLNISDYTHTTSGTILLASSEQTVTGKKTFNILPESSVVPTTDNQLVNKKYVDDNMATKQDTLVSGTNIKTINGSSILGSDNLDIAGTKTILEDSYISDLDYGTYAIGDESTSVKMYVSHSSSSCYISTSKGFLVVGPNSTNYKYFWFFVVTGQCGSGAIMGSINEMLMVGTTQTTYFNADQYIPYKNLMNLNKTQTITAKKTFNVLPESNVVPTTSNQLVNKSYVDNTIIQKSTMPTASSTNEGVIYQFIGTTDGTYTNGYFYKCVSDGASTPTYSWQNISVQSGGGGGSSTDVQINGTSIVSNDTANIITETAYDSSTNKIATMSDVNTKSVVGLLDTSDYSSSANALVLENLKPGVYYVENNTTSSFYIKALNSSTTSNYISNATSSTSYTIILTQTPSSSMSNNTVLGEILTNKISFSSGDLLNNMIRIIYNTSYPGDVNTSPKSYATGGIMSTATAQTVSGKKTFTTLPESSVTPTNTNQLTNKNYVDSKITYGITDLGPSDTLADGTIYIVYDA